MPIPYKAANHGSTMRYKTKLRSCTLSNTNQAL